MILFMLTLSDWLCSTDFLTYRSFVRPAIRGQSAGPDAFFAPWSGIQNPGNFCLWNLRLDSSLPRRGSFGSSESPKNICWEAKRQPLNPGNLSCGVRNSGLWIQDLESHQGLESGMKVPLTKYPESSTWNPESTVWNPKSKTVLYLLTWGYALGQCFVPYFTYELTQSVLAPNRLSCPVHTVCPGNKHQDRNCDSCCLCL